MSPTRRHTTLVSPVYKPQLWKDYPSRSLLDSFFDRIIGEARTVNNQYISSILTSNNMSSSKTDDPANRGSGGKKDKGKGKERELFYVCDLCNNTGMTSHRCLRCSGSGGVIDVMWDEKVRQFREIVIQCPACYGSRIYQFHCVCEAGDRKREEDQVKST
jgi:hypothetical protein